MDFLEIMNFCGFDMDKAHKMAKEAGAVELSEIGKDEKQEDSHEYGRNQK